MEQIPSLAPTATVSDWSYVGDSDLASSSELSGIIPFSLPSSDGGLEPPRAPHAAEKIQTDARHSEIDAAEKQLALRAATDALARLQSENASLRATLQMRTLERSLPVSAAILKSAQDVQRLMDDLCAKETQIAMLRPRSVHISVPATPSSPVPHQPPCHQGGAHLSSPEPALPSFATSVPARGPCDAPAIADAYLATVKEAHQGLNERQLEVEVDRLKLGDHEPASKLDESEGKSESIQEAPTIPCTSHNVPVLPELPVAETRVHSSAESREPSPASIDPTSRGLPVASGTEPAYVSKNQWKKAQKRARYEGIKAEKAVARAAAANGDTEGHNAPPTDASTSTKQMAAPAGKGVGNPATMSTTWTAKAKRATKAELKEAAEVYARMSQEAGALLQALLERHKVLEQMTFEELHLQEKGFYRLSKEEMEIVRGYPEVVTIDGETWVLSSPLLERGAPSKGKGQNAGSGYADLEAFWRERDCELGNNVYMGSDASTEIGIEYVEEDDDEEDDEDDEDDGEEDDEDDEDDGEEDDEDDEDDGDDGVAVS